MGSEFADPASKTDKVLDVGVPQREHRIIRMVAKLNREERWEKLLAVAKKSKTENGRLRSLIYEFRASIQLGDQKEIERCEKALAEVTDADETLRQSAALVKWRLPAQAAAVLDGLPQGFQSGVATKIAKRIKRLTREKPIHRKVRRFISESAPKASVDSVTHRYPGDIGRGEIPPSHLEVIRGEGVAKEIEELVISLIARSNVVLVKGRYPYVKEYTDVFTDKYGALSTAVADHLDANATEVDEPSGATRQPSFDEAFSCLGKHKGYFEWIVRRLSSLSWYLEPGAPNCPILLRKEHWGLAVDALGSLGVSKHRLVVIDGPVFCHRLYVGHVTMPTLARKPAFERVYGDLIKAAERKNDRQTPRRFYISRRDSARRSMADEAAFERDLAGRGIAPIILSELGLLEKISLFRNAELVIGAHGAGFSHLAFAKPGMRVIEIAPTSLAESKMLGVQTCFMRLSAVYGHHHTFLLRPIDTATSEWRPDIAEIDRILAAE